MLLIGIKIYETDVNLDAAKEAVQEVRKEYNLSDYHFSELESVHRNGLLTTKTHSLPGVAEWHYDFARFRTEPQGFQESFHRRIQQRRLPNPL